VDEEDADKAGRNEQVAIDNAGKPEGSVIVANKFAKQATKNRNTNSSLIHRV
jgi:hypothetical protein